MEYDTRLRLERLGVFAVGVLSVVMLSFLAARGLAAYSSAADLAATGLVDGGCAVGSAAGTRLLCFDFVWYSVATGVLVGVVGPLIGSYVVHREMALIGETLAHTAFAGVAFGILFGSTTNWGVPILLAALVTGIIGAFGVQYLAGRTATHGDVPIAIVLTGSFAIGTIVISLGRGFGGVSIDAYLFGQMAAVTQSGAQLMGVVSVLVVALVALNYKQFLFITFDEQAARVARLNVSAYNTLLILLTAVVVVGAMQILGIILVTAMLVVPVAAASALADSFREAQYLSILVGELSVLVGIAAAFSYGLAPGGSIVVVAIAIYLLAVAVSNRDSAVAAGA
ncbi:MAG: metal ABC transporter permease [Halorubrum sp.]